MWLCLHWTCDIKEEERWWASWYGHPEEAMHWTGMWFCTSWQLAQESFCRYLEVGYRNSRRSCDLSAISTRTFKEEPQDTSTVTHFSKCQNAPQFQNLGTLPRSSSVSGYLKQTRFSHLRVCSAHQSTLWKLFLRAAISFSLDTISVSEFCHEGIEELFKHVGRVLGIAHPDYYCTISELISSRTF